MTPQSDPQLLPQLPQTLKYQSQLPTNCPCKNGPALGLSYRAVHSPVTNKHFVPIALMDPTRLDTCKGDPCGLWGLSMYESPDKLKQMIIKVEQRARNFRKIVGDHYVSLVLTDKHGKRDNSDQHGHFNFYEYENLDCLSLADTPKAMFP